MNTQQSSENPRRAATTATIRAYLVPVLVILLVITGGFSIYALNTGLRTNVESNAQGGNNNPNQHADCYPHLLGRSQRVTRPKLHRRNPSRSGDQGRRQGGYPAE